MGKAGIEIGLDGPAKSYDERGIGDEATAAIEELHKKLEQLGFTITFSAVMTPTQSEESAAAAAAPAAEPVHQMPVEDGTFKCDQCGLTYAQEGVCVGGEYAHPPNALRTAADVLADASAEQAATVEQTATTAAVPVEKPAWPAG